MSTNHDTATRTFNADETARLPRALAVAFDLIDAGGRDRIKPARNLIEYTETNPMDLIDGAPAMTAWHARERLHRTHGSAVCYVDPDAKRADVLAYLADVIRAVSTVPDWPPQAHMTTTSDWPQRMGKRRVGFAIGNPYTGSRIDLSLHEKDTGTAPGDVLAAMRADLAADTESAEPVRRTVEHGKHRLVLDLRSGRHFDTLADTLAKACEQYATVAALAERTDNDAPF